MGGKFRVGPGDHTGGATGADVDHRAHRIGKVFAPLLGGRTPAAFTTGNTMVDASGPIPGSTDIPFHIRVVNEELTIAVQGEVNRVTVAHVHNLTFLAVRAHFHDPSAWSLTSFVVPIGIVLQKVIVFPVVPNAGLLVFRGGGVVARYDVKIFPVRRDNNGVRAMFASSIHLRQEFSRS